MGIFSGIDDAGWFVLPVRLLLGGPPPEAPDDQRGKQNPEPPGNPDNKNADHPFQ